MGTLFLILIILLIIGALPTWPYSSGWGYLPDRGIGIGFYCCVGPGSARQILTRAVANHFAPGSVPPL